MPEQIILYKKPRKAPTLIPSFSCDVNVITSRYELQELASDQQIIPRTNVPKSSYHLERLEI